MVKVKGPLFKGTIKFIKEKYGEEKWQEIYQKLPEEIKEFLKKPILDNTFYPAEYLIKINEAIVPPDSAEALKIYKEIGSYSAEQAVHGIYKLLFKIGTPKFMIGRAGLVWKTYYSQGKLETEPLEGNKMRIYITNSEINHISLCARIEGFIEKATELVGGKYVKAKHTKCFLERNEIEEWIVSWL